MQVCLKKARCAVDTGKKRSFSLLEVLIGAVIIAISLGGLLSVFVGSRKYIRQSQKRLGAYNVGRQVLDDLRGSVAASNWDAGNSPLAPGTYPNYKTVTLEGIKYIVDYEVANVAASGSGDSAVNRAVKVKVKYTSD